MAFKPAQIIQVQACPVCQGKGCQACGQFGMTAEMENQRLIFSLPGFFDLEARQTHKRSVFIRRFLLIIVALMAIFLTWSLLL